MSKLIICNSCGAQFGEDFTKCPYCGTMNYKGAEAEYLKKLENVREEMDELDDISHEYIETEVKKQGKFLKKIWIIIAIVLLLFVGIRLLSEKSFSYERDEREDYLWRQENIPMIDQLYADRDFEALAEFMQQAVEENRPIWDWEHYQFMDVYQSYLNVREMVAEEEAGAVGRYTYRYLFTEALQVMGASYNEALTEEELELLRPNVEWVTEYFYNCFPVTEEELNGFYQEINEYGVMIDYDACEAYVDEWFETREGQV